MRYLAKNGFENEGYIKDYFLSCIVAHQICQAAFCHASISARERESKKVIATLTDQSVASKTAASFIARSNINLLP